MLRSNSPVIFLAAVLLSLPLRLSAEEICEVEKCLKDTEIGCFRGVSKVDDEGKELTKEKLRRTFMRTNPSGSLKCFQQQVATTGSKEMQCLSAFSGVIGGDVKPDNADMMKIDGKWRIVLIDLDDGGLGSLLGDVFHTLAYNEVWKTKIPFNEAIEAYRLGLKGEALDGIPSLERIVGNSPSPKRSCKEPEMSVKDAEPWVKNLYGNDKKSFEQVIRHIDNTWDGKNETGFDMKTTSGGSMCMPRFTYRVHDGNHKERCDIVQFKLQRTPDAEAIDHEKRVYDLIKHYRGGSMENLVKEKPVVQGEGGRYYIARYDRKPQFDEEWAKNPKKKRAYVKHMLHWLGRVHAEQNSVYAKQFTEKFPAIRDELKRMIDSHIKYMEEQARKLELYQCGP